LLSKCLTIEEELPSFDLFRPRLFRISERVDLIPRAESDDGVKKRFRELAEEARREAEGTKSGLTFRVGVWVVVRGCGRVDYVPNDLYR